MTVDRLFAASQPHIRLQRSLADYAIALAAPVAITLFRSVLPADPAAEAPFIPYLAGVALAAWRGGLWPGLIATAWSAVLASTFRQAPPGALFASPAIDSGLVILFTAVGGTFSGVCEQLQRSRGHPGVDAETILAHQLELEREVAERKRAEVALRENEERLRMALEASSTVAWDWNLATGVTERSATSRQVLGLRSGPAQQQLDLVHPEDRPMVQEVLDRALRGEGTYDLEYRVLRADGETRWVADVGNLVYDVDEKAERMVGCLRDITLLKEVELEQQRALAALAEADQRKDEFLAILAHELRNPLAPIRSSVRILQTSGEVSAPQRRHLAVIDRQVGNMARLLDDLLDVSRITRGVVQLKLEKLDLHEVIIDAVECTRPFIRTQEHELTIDLPADPLPLRADRLRLEQVFVNLLNNAAKYTDPGGRLSVAVSIEAPGSPAGEAYAVVSIRDTGRGISRQVLPQIFELFVQGEQGFNRTFGGLGIGLTMVRSLVEMHGGRVEAASAGCGQGSEFTVRLPLLKSEDANTRTELHTLPPAPGLAAALPAQPAAVAPSASARRILIVDDNRDGAEALAEIVEFWEHETCAVYDGPAALRAVTEFAPQIVICDLGMPGMDGFEVARRIVAMEPAPDRPRPILIALTGYGREDDRAHSRAAGFDHHLIKPVDPEELQALLQALCS